MAGVCMRECETCSLRQEYGCRGCLESGGQPFWGSCQVVACCHSPGAAELRPVWRRALLLQGTGGAAPPGGVAREGGPASGPLAGGYGPPDSGAGQMAAGAVLGASLLPGGESPGSAGHHRGIAGGRDGGGGADRPGASGGVLEAGHPCPGGCVPSGGWSWYSSW